MKLILEKDEVVAILSKHFDVGLDPEKVIIRVDPFEIEVCGLPLSPSEERRHDENVVPLKTKAKPLPRRADENATLEAPEPGNDGTEPSDDTVHPASVLATSKALEQELDKENPKLRRAGSNYSHVPPSDTTNEI